MKKNHEKEKYSVRTDLAVEMKEMVSEKTEYTEEIPGVRSKDYHVNGIKVTQIEITDLGEKHLQKSKGSYVTIFSDAVIKNDTNTQFATIKALTAELKKLLARNQLREDSKALIVGLGNWNVTPDALGPL